MFMDMSSDIFKETACLSEEQLRDYLRGNLSQAEMHEIEVHLSSCTFCSEALEGIVEMKQPEELSGIVQQIRSRFKHQLHPHYARNRKSKNYLWLAVLVFIIIVILLIAYYAVNLTMKGEHRSAPETEQVEPGR